LNLLLRNPGIIAEAKISGFPKKPTEPEWRHPEDVVWKKTHADFIENLPLDKGMIAAWAKKENRQPTFA
jgi:hypothetical protein